ncbi:MAG TPA: HlyD family secretion protein [Bacteroidota bacterium]|nr:HlyD family secretion protein [Bacteroidota bacterium]
MNQPTEQRGEAPISQETAGEEGDIDALPLYRKKRILIPFAFLIILAAGGLWYYYTQIRGFDSTDDAFVDGNRVSISSKMLGRIVFLAADEGDSVKQGEVLVRLDDADLRAQEAQAEAGLEDARQAEVLAQVNVDRAQDDYQRAETQYKTKVISQEQFEHARSALAAANSQQKIAVSRIATAQAQINVVRTSLSNMTIVAPMDGIVAKRYALPGDVVQAGQPILSVYDLRSVWVTANFEETKVGSLKIGDGVEISVDAYPDLTLRGTVILFGASTASQYSLIPPNNASGNFTKVTQRIPVKIQIDRIPEPKNDPHPLLPGMSVEVRVKTH